MAFASALMTSLPFCFRRFWIPSPDLYLRRETGRYIANQKIEKRSERQFSFSGRNRFVFVIPLEQL